MRERILTAGVYIERNGALLLRAYAERDGPKDFWRLDYKDHEPVSWSNDKDEAEEELKTLADLITRSEDDLAALGVAGYGPFLSLDTNDKEKFGKTNPNTAHWPLRGSPIASIFLDALEKRKHERKVEFCMNTDANACAIGEAMARQTHSETNVAYLLVGEGVGLGLVRGRTPIPSALHPEVGIMHVRIDPDEEREFDKGQIQYAWGLAEMTSHEGMVKRIQRRRPHANLSEDDLRNYMNDNIWDSRAYYLAQACLACTAILPPSVIAIDAYIDPRRDIATRVESKFRSLLQSRNDKKQPVFEFKELEEEKELGEPPYIDSSKQTLSLKPASKIASTGAFGICHAAADTWGSNNIASIAKVVA